jgi:hypothetical protein
MTQQQSLQFQFASQVLFDVTIDDGYMKHYVPIPPEISQSLQQGGITHVEGKLNEHEFRRVIHQRPDGSQCLKFGKFWLDEAKLEVNTEIRVELMPDPDPERVDLPQELTWALTQAPPDVLERWSNLSVSRQKTLAYGIARAKKSETRQKRADAIVEDLQQVDEDN